MPFIGEYLDEVKHEENESVEKVVFITYETFI